MRSGAKLFPAPCLSQFICIQKHYIILFTIHKTKYQKHYTDKDGSVRYDNIEGMVPPMYEKEFAQRLAQLRAKRGISARDMSLSMGQNPGYINSIENGKSFPTMMNFFYICEFLHLSPSEFFDMSSDDPEKLRLLMESIKKLSDRQVDSLTVIVDGMLNK